MFNITCNQSGSHSLKRSQWKGKRELWLLSNENHSTILRRLQNSHWTLLMGQSLERSPRRPRSETTLSDHETKRREAVWELFHSEVVYLMSHLLVLKEVRIGSLTRISDKMPTMSRIHLLH